MNTYVVTVMPACASCAENLGSPRQDEPGKIFDLRHILFNSRCAQSTEFSGMKMTIEIEADSVEEAEAAAKVHFEMDYDDVTGKKPWRKKTRGRGLAPATWLAAWARLKDGS